MSLVLRVAARTDVGRVRAGNEDSLLVADDARLLAVADGMGGHQAGEVASATAVEVLRTEVAAGRSVDEAVVVANRLVRRRAEQDPALRGMGTTVTAAIVVAGTLRIAHVGDSRAYLLRDGAFRQVTVDHSVVAELVAAGELTEEEALVDRRRSMITRALGIDAEVRVDVLTVELEVGDRLLLCSDGLTTMLRDPAIAAILSATNDREAAADALVAAANDAGGVDNITVIVADVKPGDTPGTDPEPGGPMTGDPADPPDDPPDGAPADPADGSAPRRRRWWSRRSAS